MESIKIFTGHIKVLYFILHLIRYCWRVLDGAILDSVFGESIRHLYRVPVTGKDRNGETITIVKAQIQW